MEAFWARMQVELLDRQRWRTLIELANAIFEYLEIFHNHELATRYKQWLTTQKPICKRQEHPGDHQSTKTGGPQTNRQSVYCDGGLKGVLPGPQMWGRVATPWMNRAASARVASRLGQYRPGPHPETTSKSVNQAIPSV